MPIRFKVDESGRYFVSHYEGSIEDAELVPSYSAFFSRPEYLPGLHELADFSGADLSGVTIIGIRMFASWARAFYKKHGLQNVKLAAYFPRGGNVEAIIYDVWSIDSAEHLRLFKDRDEAIRWSAAEDGT